MGENWRRGRESFQAIPLSHARTRVSEQGTVAQSLRRLPIFSGVCSRRPVFASVARGASLKRVTHRLLEERQSVEAAASTPGGPPVPGVLPRGEQSFKLSSSSSATVDRATSTDARCMASGGRIGSPGNGWRARSTISGRCAEPANETPPSLDALIDRQPRLPAPPSAAARRSCSCGRSVMIPMTVRFARDQVRSRRSLPTPCDRWPRRAWRSIPRTWNVACLRSRPRACAAVTVEKRCTRASHSHRAPTRSDSERLQRNSQDRRTYRFVEMIGRSDGSIKRSCISIDQSRVSRIRGSSHLRDDSG
jgi:hypothetical protein